MSKVEGNNAWWSVANVAEIPSPALLVYPARIDVNLRRMLAIAGGPGRLRPHVKTHKMPELVRRQRALGIAKFKCSTIAEAEMTAAAGALDVLLAYQATGPNAARLAKLAKKFPNIAFSTIADDADTITLLSKAAIAAGVRIGVYLDVDCGMQRTGIAPGPRAIELYAQIANANGLRAAGLHVYDGHNHEPDLAARAARCEADFFPVAELRRQLDRQGLFVPNVVAGGTPTFPLHAHRAGVECSPGTCVLWDFGYGEKLPDLDFQVAAVLLTRVASKPGAGRLCLDLGHKAVAAENPQPRVKFLNLPDAVAVMHSEEHLVVETPAAAEFAVGDCIYAVPRHICPTCALHSEAVVVENGRATGRWAVAARDRVLTI